MAIYGVVEIKVGNRGSPIREDIKGNKTSHGCVEGRLKNNQINLAFHVFVIDPE